MGRNFHHERCCFLLFAVVVPIIRGALILMFVFSRTTLYANVSKHLMTTRLSQLVKCASESSAVNSALSSLSIIGCSFQTLRMLPSISRGFADSAASGPPDGHYVTLNSISDNPGANKTVRSFVCSSVCFSPSRPSLVFPLLLTTTT